MAETIQVVYTRAGTAPVGLFYHETLVYTNSSGQMYYASGGPEHGSSDVASGSVDSWGRIVDNTEEVTDPTAVLGPADAPYPATTVASGDNLSSQWGAIQQAARDIDSGNFPYSPFYQNSNSAANTALTAAGISPPIDNEVFSDHWAPGAANILPIPGISDSQSDPLPADPTSGAYIPESGGDLGGAQHDPLVIDLAGNGLDLVSRSAFSPYFDFTGSGFAKNTAWIGAGSGFLALVGADGLVHDGTQLFGTGAQSGFQALRALDSNGDGIINASDANFSKLIVWQDINADGVCQPSEVFTLAQLGIASISLRSRAVTQSAAGATISETAVVTMVDGSTRKIAEVNLDVSSVYTRYVGSYTLDPAVYALPGLQGYGTLPSLSISMSQDGQLKTLVQQLVQVDPSNVGSFDQALRAVLYRWAGVDVITSTSSDLFDRQALGFLRALLGNTSGFLGYSDGPFLSDQVALVQKSWDEAFAGLKARVLAQLPNSPFQASFNVFPGADLLTPRGQLSAAITYLGQNAPSTAAAQAGYWSNVLLLVSTSVSDFRQFGTPDVSSITASLQSVVPTYFSPEIVEAAAFGTLSFVEGTAVAGQLVGTSSSDLFTADQANATLTGFGGGDEFVVGSGLGAIEINEADNTGQSANILLLTGTAPSQVSVSGNAAGDIVLTLGNGDTVKLDGMLTSSGNPADGSTQYGVQQIRFADGTVWGVQQLIQQELSATSNPGTALYGSSGADTLDGQGLKHVLQGNGGNDTFVFNQGYGALEVKEADGRSIAANVLQLGNGIMASQVAVTGTANGDIVLTTGATGDLIKLDGMLTSKRNGVQTVRFANGSTWSAQQLRALADIGAPNNVRLIDFLGGATLDPAGYAHLVTTRGGNNTVLFNLGYGAVEINQHSSKAQDVNVLQFGSGIAPSQVTINGDTHGNVVLTVGSNGDRVQLDSMLLGSGNGVQTVHFADGTVWSAQQIVSQVPGGSGADQYFTTFAFDKGVGVAATVVLGHGAITLGYDIAAGDAYLQTDGAGDLIVRLRDAPDDSLTIGNALYSDVDGVHNRLSQLTYADGTTLDLTLGLSFTWLADSTSLVLTGSNDGANVFELAPGGDVVTGSSQTANTFVFHKGDGHATIIPTGGSGTIKLATGIAASDVMLQANTAGDLVVQLRDTGDSLTIMGDLSGQPWGVQSQVSQITFGDGTTLALGQPYFDEGLPLSFTWVGTGNGPLAGSGFGSNTFIIGPGSAHVLAGNGAQGGSDANTFVFAKGDGNAIVDMNNAAGSLLFGADIPASDVIFQANAAGDLTVLLRDDPADSIVFKGDLSSQPWGVQSLVSQITFGDGTTLALGQPYFDEGLPLNFTWVGTATNTTLVGSGYGSNTFNLGAGGDTVTFGKGDLGGSPQNTVLFDRGNGAVTVNVNTGSGSLVLGADIPASDVIFQANAAGDLTVLLRDDPADSIIFKGDLSSQPWGVQSLVSQITFGDGTTLALGQPYFDEGLPLSFTWVGTATNTTLVGSGFGANTFEFGPGGDTVTAGAGQAATYIFGKGDGQATINANGTVGQIPFVTGLTPSDVSFTTSTNKLVITITATGESLTVEGPLTGSSTAIQKLVFADGTVWGAPKVGSSKAETLTGAEEPDTFDSKGAPSGSQDYVQGGGGNDTFIFARGYGQLEISESDYASVPSNILKLGSGITASQLGVAGDSSGNLILTDGTSGDRVILDGELSDTSNGVQSVQFADGTSLSRAQLITIATTGTTGADTLYGSSGGDILDGKGAPSGSQDYAQGNGGNDTFMFNRGYGQLEISETDYGSAPSNMLKLGSGITAAQLKIVGDSSGNLLLTDGTSGDEIILDGELNDPANGVQSVRFADGSSLSRAQMITAATTGTAAAADTLYGSSGADILDGKGAPSGSQDYAQGNGGNDTFVFNSGYGKLEINETDYGNVPANMLQLGAGISHADIKAAKSSDGSGIVLTIGSSGDQVTLDQMLSNTASGIQTLRFIDGTSWTAKQLTSLAKTGTTAANTITGTIGNDVFDGRGGADAIAGKGAYDTYFFRKGYGQLTITNGVTNGTAASGELDLGSGLTKNNLWFANSSGDLLITELNSQDTITIKSWFGSSAGAKLSEIVGYDGMKLDAGMANLVTAMATYSSNHAGFKPSTATQMPTDSALQSVLGAAWHA